MGNIIVAFPRQEDAKCIKNLLVRHGFSVNYICTSGSQVLECLDGMNDGIVACVYTNMSAITYDISRLHFICAYTIPYVSHCL